MAKQTSSTFYETFIFDSPIAFQLMEAVLQRLHMRYSIPDAESDKPVYMLRIVASPGIAKRLFKLCEQYLSTGEPLISTAFTPQGGFVTARAWEFKLLSVQFTPESIPQVVEEIASSAPTR